MNPPSAHSVFVEVAVPLPIDHPFTYRVPSGQEARARIGVRVLVPFGHRKVTGLITALVDGSSLGGREAREVLAFLDEEPYVSPSHLAFLAAAARECLAPLGEMLRAALHGGLPRRGAPAGPRTEGGDPGAGGGPGAAPRPPTSRTTDRAEGGFISPRFYRRYRRWVRGGSGFASGVPPTADARKKRTLARGPRSAASEGGSVRGSACDAPARLRSGLPASLRPPSFGLLRR